MSSARRCDVGPIATMRRMCERIRRMTTTICHNSIGGVPLGRRLLLGMEEIRRARAADVAAIASLMTHLGYHTTADQMRRRMQRISVDKDYVSLVAAEENVVVGFLGLVFGLHYEHDGIYARIVALSVAPGAQGRGVGRKLLAVAEEIATSRGALTCIVNSGLQRCGDGLSRAP